MRPVDLPLPPQRDSGDDELGILEPATDEVDEVDFCGRGLGLARRCRRNSCQFRRLHGIGWRVRENQF